MAYTKTVFVNGGAPGISQTELNKIGDGISDAHDAAAAAAADLATHEASLTNPHQVTGVLVFSTPGKTYVHSGRGRLKLPFPIVIVDCTLTVGVAPTGADVIFDVNKDGVTIFTTQGNRPKVPAASQDGTATTPDVTVCAAGTVLTADVDQVGSAEPGRDATLTIRYRETG